MDINISELVGNSIAGLAALDEDDSLNVLSPHLDLMSVVMRSEGCNSVELTFSKDSESWNFDVESDVIRDMALAVLDACRRSRLGRLPVAEYDGTLRIFATQRPRLRISYRYTVKNEVTVE